MIDFKVKAAFVSRWGTQSAAAKVLKAAGCPGMTERRLSRILHGYERPRPEEVQVLRELVGIELPTAEHPAALV
jgi:hypothetical protein